MKSSVMRSRVPLWTFFIVTVSFVCCCSNPRGNGKDEPTGNNIAMVEPADSICYNFYVENSGSMKGYFSGKGTTGLETLIAEYYDRINESKNDNDRITLNYINTKKVETNNAKTDFLRKARSVCNESYSPIDNIMVMSMESADENNVNILISDCCYESDFGGLDMAKSHITSLFTEQLKKNSHLSLAILKYMVDFDGYYFPGHVRCKKEMPVYFWIFGNESNIKRITQLKIDTQPSNLFLLQAVKSITFKIIDMISQRSVQADTAIVVSEWKPDRKDNIYNAALSADLKDVILPDSDLIKAENYKVIERGTSSEYDIKSISGINEGIYKITFSTSRPSPGELTLYYPFNLPTWVSDYSYSERGLPPDSMTYGIKELIAGAYEAYHNKSDHYFDLTITLVK